MQSDIPLDSKQMPLNDWLEIVFDGSSEPNTITYSFPTENHLNEYLASINTRTDEEIKRLLEAFLIPSTSLGCDEDYLQYLEYQEKSEPEIYERKLKIQFYKRLIRYEYGFSRITPWEGITWILDLLPDKPQQAIESIRNYFDAHIQQLPDGRAMGLGDAMAMIRARYIGLPKTDPEALSALLDLSPRNFEHLISKLYELMGYATFLTPATRDGGRDILATNTRLGKLEHLRIECKRYAKPVGVSVIRALLGVVTDEKVNKGIVVTTSHFTKSALDFCKRNPRLEPISGYEVVQLLNQHLGPKWPVKLDSLVLSTGVTSDRDLSNAL